MRAARLLAAAVVAAAVAGAGAPVAGAGEPLGAVIVAAGPTATSATRVDGSGRVELPWLLPGDRDIAVSPEGRRIAFVSDRDGNPEVYVADATTREVSRLTLNPRGHDRRPSWSPDGRRLAWQSGPPGDADLYVMDADGRRKRALVRGAGDDADPAWSPDGTRVAFASNRGGRRDLWAVPASGGEPELLADVAGTARAPAWSPDGTRIAFSRQAGGDADLWLRDLATGEQRQVTDGPGADGRPDWAPDGRRLAYARAAGGASAIWTVRPTGDDARPVPGTRGDADPDWAVAMPALVPAADELLPDLEQRAPTGLVVVAGESGGYRLGFDSAVENLGRGPLHIRGARPAATGPMRADQLVELRGGGVRVTRAVGRLRYEPHTPHFHWHLQPFVRYELHRAPGFELVVRDRKTGFCLIDRYGLASRRAPRAAPPRFVGDCATRRPDARRVEEGTSVGYVDRYPALFHGQDVDLTGLRAGLYVLVHRANPDRTMRESRYSNDAASLLLRLTWPQGRRAAPSVAVLRRCEASERCPPM